MTLTPTDKEKGGIARYTQDEKDILFDLFKAYEEIIDIKHRKKSRRKTMEVRQCWQEIMDSYNNDSRITTRRNLKQLQKFWLNARLRKIYPFNHDGASEESKDYRIVVSKANINYESSKTLQHEKQNISHTLAPERHIKYEIQILNEGGNLSSLASPPKDASMHDDRQMSIETISSDNLSLNDLLEFRTSNQNSELLEGKSNRKISDQIDDEVTEENATDLYYGNPISGDENEEIGAKVLVAQNIDAVLKEQFRKPDTLKDNCKNPCCCNHYQHHDATQKMCRCLNDKINEYRIKEAEMKFKEQQLRVEKESVELEKSREELRHMKEFHELKIQEMKVKLKQLQGEPLD